MPKPTFILTVLAFVAAVLVLGCGESNDGETTVSGGGAVVSENRAPLAKWELIKAGDAICRKADREQNDKAAKYRVDHAKELAKLSPIAAEEKLIRTIMLPSIMLQARELEALGAPRGEERKFGNVIAGIEAGVRKARKNPYGIELEPRTVNPLLEATELLREYGFGDCRNLA